MRKNYPFQETAVEAVFATYPTKFRKKLLFLRQLIFEIADRNKEVGKLSETLKWGEPSYVTEQTGSGSTIRIDWKKSYPNQYAIYFNCRTRLVDTFKEKYNTLFNFQGNRAIIFKEQDHIPVKELSDCIAMALTYNQRKEGYRQ